MTTQKLLEAIAADLRTQLSGLRTCEVHNGRWDADAIDRWSVEAPAMLVTWLGTASTEQPGLAWTDCDQQLALFVMTTDVPRQGAPAAGPGPAWLERGEAARALVDWLLLYIPRARWGYLGDIGAATRIRAANLYSKEVDNKNMAIWMVSWLQKIRLETADASGRVPPLPTELYSIAQGDRPPTQLLPEAP